MTSPRVARVARFEPIRKSRPPLKAKLFTDHEVAIRLVDHIQVIEGNNHSDALRWLERMAALLRERIAEDAPLRAMLAQAEQPASRFQRERDLAVANCLRAGATRCATWLAAHPRMAVAMAWAAALALVAEAACR